MISPDLHLKAVPFGAVLARNRRPGKIFGLYGKVYKVVEVDRTERTLLLERISQDVRERSGTIASI